MRRRQSHRGGVNAARLLSLSVPSGPTRPKEAGIYQTDPQGQLTLHDTLGAVVVDAHRNSVKIGRTRDDCFEP